MTAPKRIQRKRTKGWRMPEGALYVGRPTRWGNPFVMTGDTVLDFPAIDYRSATPGHSRRVVVDHFRSMILAGQSAYVDVPALTVDEIRANLAGRDLACWCPLEDAEGNRVPCHADVLLEIANGGAA